MRPILDPAAGWPLHLPTRKVAIRLTGLGAAAGLVIANILAGPAAKPTTPATDTQIAAYVASQLQDSGIAGGALAIVRDGRISLAGGFGIADASGRPVSAQTPFVIGSLSKSITALAVMQLVDAGRIELDAPVQRYLPDFTLADPRRAAAVTVRELLEQTSSIPTSAGVAPLTQAPTSLQAQVRALAAVRPDSTPGAQFTYSNANYEVLGLLVERVSGEPFDRYVEDRIFGPLEMSHASLDLATAQHNGLTMAHRLWFGLSRETAPLWRPDLAPAGWMTASAEDLGHFLMAQLDGGTYAGTRIVSAQAIAEMQKGVVPMGFGTSGRYGLGWVDSSIGDVRVVAHSGSTTDMAGIELFAPGRGNGLVLLSNTQSTLYELLRKIDAIGTAAFAMELGQPASGTFALLYPAFDLVVALLIGWSLVTLVRSIRILLRGQVPQPRWLGNAKLGAIRAVWLDGIAPVEILLQAPNLLGASWATLVRIDIGLVLALFALLRLATGLALVAAAARGRWPALGWWRSAEASA